MLLTREERVDLRRHGRVFPCGDIEACHGVEDVRRVELPTSSVEGGGQGAGSIIKEVTSCGAERPSADHSDERTSVESALVDGGFDLQKKKKSENRLLKAIA